MNGNSEIPFFAYYSGTPVGVSTTTLNLQQYTLVIDTSSGALRVKTSSADNSAFSTLATTTSALTPTSIAATGAITSSSPTAGIGYAAGAGGAVTQITSKATGVTLDKVTGAITMNNASLAAGAEVAFTLTNATISAGDVIVVNVKSGGTSAAYDTCITAVAGGSCEITLTNLSAGALGEAVVLSFFVLKGQIA